MVDINKVMENVFKRCTLALDGQEFSQEKIAKSFSKFLAATSDREQHNVGIVLHTGSVIFDAIAIAYAAISNMILNESQTMDIIETLQIGDIVLYSSGKSVGRYTYEGHGCPSGCACSSDFILLQQGVENITYVPPTRWREIMPYLRNSKSLDGRGIRKKTGIRDDFYKEVLGLEDKDIPSVIDTSTVLLMSKDRADKLVKGLEFHFFDKKIKLLELVTVSYFTENEEFAYGGNVGGNEPVIKITSKANVARRYIRKKGGNRHLGLIVSGSGTVTKNYTELPELIDRKALKYVYILMHIDSDHGSEMVAQYEKCNLFACTSEFLRTNLSKRTKASQLTEELDQQIDAILNHQIEPIILDNCIGWDDYNSFRKSMYAIKMSDYESEDKNYFIIHSHSLMNLLLTSVFSISKLEKTIDQGKLNVVSPSAKFDELSKLCDIFPEYLKQHANKALDLIAKLYLHQWEESEKGIHLRNILEDHCRERIAVIVPKAYYADVLKYEGLWEIMETSDLLTVSTANMFDNSQIYDLIIAVGDFSGKRFDAFRCRASKHIITLLYTFESRIFRYKLNQSKELEKSYDRRCGITLDTDANKNQEYGQHDVEEIEKVGQITKELDEYVEHLNNLAAVQGIGYLGESTNNTAEVVAVVTFETGEKALLTKMYKAYVIDENVGSVTEMSVENLSEGASLVFTKNNEETRDIVDSVLNKLLKSGKFNQDVVDKYYKSKKWRKSLMDYMNRFDLTPRKVADQMINNGVRVQPATIRNWLDEDAHMVAPQQEESLQQIALLVNDDEMFVNSGEYHEACNTIRKIRKTIRKDIGKAIINNLRGQPPEYGADMAEVYDKIDTMAQVLRIESITAVKTKAPLNATNKPLSVKE